MKAVSSACQQKNKQQGKNLTSSSPSLGTAQDSSSVSTRSLPPPLLGHFSLERRSSNNRECGVEDKNNDDEEEN